MVVEKIGKNKKRRNALFHMNLMAIAIAFQHPFVRNLENSVLVGCHHTSGIDLAGQAHHPVVAPLRIID